MPGIVCETAERSLRETPHQTSVGITYVLKTHHIFPFISSLFTPRQTSAFCGDSVFAVFHLNIVVVVGAHEYCGQSYNDRPNEPIDLPHKRTSLCTCLVSSCVIKMFCMFAVNKMNGTLQTRQPDSQATTLEAMMMWNLNWLWMDFFFRFTLLHLVAFVWRRRRQTANDCNKLKCNLV